MDMMPRRVVAKKATSPGLVFKLNFMLRASNRLHRKNGVQHTRKQTKYKQSYRTILRWIIHEKTEENGDLEKQKCQNIIYRILLK